MVHGMDEVFNSSRIRGLDFVLPFPFSGDPCVSVCYNEVPSVPF